MRSMDTSEDIHELGQELRASMSMSDRLAMTLQMSDDMAAVTADGIRHRHPDYDDDQVMWALRRMYLGDELFLESTPDAPLLSS